MAKHLFHVEKRTILVGDHRIRLLILRPRNLGTERPAGVLWVHGGGYQSGSAKDVFATRALSLVVKFGAILVSPDYRLSKKHPYPAALCMLAHDRREVNIAYQMPLYPMLDDRDTPSSADNHAPNWNTKRNHRAWKRYLREAWGTDLVSCYAAPARRTDYRGLPPCYTFVGDIEPFYCETVDYVHHLQASGVEAELDVYPGWFHAYDLFFPTKKIVREAISRFEAHFAYAQAHCFAPQDPSGDSRSPE